MKKLIGIFLAILLLCGVCSCGKKQGDITEEQVLGVFELATIECYYNNVAKLEKEKGEGITHVLEVSRKFWAEYEGVAKIGIDMQKVSVKIEGNNVMIKMPSAELLSLSIVEDTLNENSIIISKDSFWNKNKITEEEQRCAINEAQKNMKEQILEDKLLFKEAENRAKKLIENYVCKVGNMYGKKYNIVWL